eukprot:2683839-Alexandrium_andersonii.AAC.1
MVRPSFSRALLDRSSDAASALSCSTALATRLRRAAAGLPRESAPTHGGLRQGTQQVLTAPEVDARMSSAL